MELMEKRHPVKNIEPQQYSFDFLIDGTGAAGYKREVLVGCRII
jgi:hypothetical protein